MAKTPPKSGSATKPAPKKPAAAIAATASSSRLRINYFILVVILFSTFVVYWSSLSNQLTNWDDQEYITYNKNLSESTFEQHFIEHPRHMGNYHPLTMLSLSWDYANAYDDANKTIDPVPFHRTNLWLHVLNTLLVYLLVFRLSQNNIVAAFTSAVFALHPMHVESVAWASERKDVLYAFFYLGAALCWTYFIEGKNKALTYGLTFLLFVLALFSKAVAVTLPLLLLAIDYFKQRKFTWKLLAEKIPFLVLSAWFGFMAIQAQKEFESLSANEIYSLGERIMFAFYGTAQYIIKFFVPTHLSCFYPYPSPGYPRGILFYLAPFIVVGVLGFLYWQRKNKNLVFGALFFVITVMLVLQLLSVGGAIMADRYTYLPYIGLAFVLGTWVEQVIRKKMVQKELAFFVPVTFVLLMAIFAYERTQVWKDSVTLWADAESRDQTSPKIYSNYGDACTIAGDYDRAIELLNRAIALNDQYPDAYYNRGLALYYLSVQHARENKPVFYQEAINDYTKAIELKPTLSQAWHNRAGTYFTIGKPKEALADALKAQELGFPVDPMFFKVLRESIAKQPK